MKSNNGKSLRDADFRVLPDQRPGWIRGSERVPSIGEPVYCAGGEGTMAALLGKTGDGSRLLQICLEDVKAPFFAAASNVLVRPE